MFRQTKWRNKCFGDNEGSLALFLFYFNYLFLIDCFYFLYGWSILCSFEIYYNNKRICSLICPAIYKNELIMDIPNKAKHQLEVEHEKASKQIKHTNDTFQGIALSLVHVVVSWSLTMIHFVVCSSLFRLSSDFWISAKLQWDGSWCRNE